MLLNRRTYGGGVIPAGLPQINWDDPINRGLRACLICQTGAASPIDLVQQQAWTVSSDVPNVDEKTPLKSVAVRELDFSGAGTNSRAAIGLDGTFNTHSWVTWAKYDSGYGSFDYINAFNSNNNTCFTNTTTQVVTRVYTDSTFRTISLGNPNDLAYHQYGATYDYQPSGTSTYSGYFDGKSRGANAHTGTIDTSISNFRLGNRTTGGRLLVGRIAQARFWGDRVLTVKDYERLYHEPWAGLVAPRYIPVTAAAVAGGNPWYYYAQQRMVG